MKTLTAAGPLKKMTKGLLVLLVVKATLLTVLSVLAGYVFASNPPPLTTTDTLSVAPTPILEERQTTPSPTDPSPPSVLEGWAAEQSCEEMGTDLAGIDCTACIFVCMFAEPLSCSICITACLASPI